MTGPMNVVTASLRAWTEPARPAGRPRTTATNKKKADRSGRGSLRDLLVLDCETTTDPTQALTFGVWRHCTVDHDGQLTMMSEGLFHADDLPTTDPAGYNAMVEHCRTELADVDRRHRRADPRLSLTSRTAFIEGTFYKLAWKARAHVVMFNKPFDLSRLALSAGASRGGFYGGFNLKLFGNDIYRPRVRVKHLDSKKAFASFSTTKERDEAWAPGQTNHGYFLDLRTWAFALTGTAYNLAWACEAFGVEHGKAVVEQHGMITPEYIRYARRDVLATAELFGKLYAEHRRHPIALEPTKAMSAASVAKAYLAGMGIPPRLQRDAARITPGILGQSMSAFYGGRAECRIRHTPVPVELHDFTSMYPTVNALMGLWRLLTADRIDAADATDDVQRFLDETVTLEELFDPDVWPSLVGIAQVLPDGDVLPVRAPYGDEPVNTIGVNPVTASKPGWWTLADLAASKILTGKAPTVLRAFRFVATGTLADLCPVRLRSKVTVDPAKEDFFVRVVELRAVAKVRAIGHPDGCGCEDCALSAFLKVLANSGSYGVFSELNTSDTPPGTTDKVRVFSGSHSPFDAAVPGREVPGPLCFPPLAACITGSARLMLAMLEQCVTDAGGVWAFCDTDSLAIVATADGRLVPCPGGAHRNADGDQCVQSLTYEQCADIRLRFSALSPYDPKVVTELLKPEQRASCLAVSAKRYALYTVSENIAGENGVGKNETVQLVPGKFSEHGLGHLLDPSDPDPHRTNKKWIEEYWTWTIRTALGHPDRVEPAWLDRPAVGAHTVSSPVLLAAFDVYNGKRAGRGTVGTPVRKPYAQQVKPFSFMIVAYHEPFPGGPGRLVAPYQRDGSTWTEQVWVDLHDPAGPGYRLSTAPTDGSEPPSAAGQYGRRTAQPGRAIAQTYRDVLAQHYRHPEPKFLGPIGQPCTPHTRGLLSRRPTAVYATRLIGKEANRVEEMDAGLLAADPTQIYAEPPTKHLVRAVLAPLTTEQILTLLQRRTPHAQTPSVRTVQRMRAGSSPSPVLSALAALLAADALDELDSAEHGQPAQPHRAALAQDRPGDILAAWAVRCAAPTVARCCGCGCGQPVTGRQLYASGACQRRSHRKRTATQ